MKLGQKIYDYKISDEFDYWSNRTRTSGVICPWIRKKKAIFHFVFTLASTNINQSAWNLIKIFMTIRSRMSRSLKSNCDNLVLLFQYHSALNLDIWCLYFRPLPHGIRVSDIGPSWSSCFPFLTIFCKPKSIALFIFDLPLKIFLMWEIVYVYLFWKGFIKKPFNAQSGV